MEIIIQPDPETASRVAARLIARQVRKNPDAVLGMATGSTPLGLYRELIRLHREEGLDFSRVTTFNLDEYIGLSPEHPQSYHHYMHVFLEEKPASALKRIDYYRWVYDNKPDWQQHGS